MHLLRCSPSTNHPALSKFDDILKVSIQRITNCDFSDLQWIQASLPVRDGGLGIRRVASLALPAFLASAASTLSLQADILSSCTPSDNNFFQSCLLSWSSQFGDLPEVLPSKQPFWDRAGVLAEKASVESSFNSSYSRASFLAACAEHSGDWLFALPLASCGLHLDDEAVRVAVCLRLGLDVCSSHVCHCGPAVDVRGIHSFICKKAPGKIMRHQASRQPTYQSPKNHRGYSVSTGSAVMVFHWSHGKVAKLSVGM